MDKDYYTIEEIAAVWGVTLRHVQCLCRDGRIAGAKKRAGAWFIPIDAHIPIKKIRSGAKTGGKGQAAATARHPRLSGAKKKIFDTAVKLIARYGYDNVSLYDIGDAIALRPAALYSHFKSKKEILDTIYDFYSYHYIANRASLEEVRQLLQTDSLLNLMLKGFRYEFDEGILGQMSDITKIITQRAATDEKAALILQNLILEEGVSFVETGLNLAVENSRLSPCDTHAMAVLINCVRLYTLLWWLVTPSRENYEKMLRDEVALYSHIAELITNLKPPAAGARQPAEQAPPPDGQ